MVRGGAGLTLLPALTVGLADRGAELPLVPFAKPVPSRTVGFAWRASSGRASEYELLAELFAAPPEEAAPGAGSRAGRYGLEARGSR
jgi:LysR family hydrogen peroxide-inducible transcriptional activator